MLKIKATSNIDKIDKSQQFRVIIFLFNFSTASIHSTIAATGKSIMLIFIHSTLCFLTMNVLRQVTVTYPGK